MEWRESNVFGGLCQDKAVEIWQEGQRGGKHGRGAPVRRAESADFGAVDAEETEVGREDLDLEPPEGGEHLWVGGKVIQKRIPRYGELDEGLYGVWNKAKGECFEEWELEHPPDGLGV